MLVEIARSETISNGRSPISVEQAIDLIETKGYEGVVNLLGYVRTSGVWSGGTSRSLFHTGAYRACKELGVNMQVQAGSSGGSIPAAYMGAGPETGMRTSPDDLEKASIEFSEALGHIIRPANFLRVVIKEGLVNSQKLEEKLRQYTNGAVMGQLNGTYIIASDFDSDHSNKVILSRETTPQEPVWSAIRKSVSHLFLFDPVRENKGTYLDGLLEIFPLLHMIS